jgi:hypothetical protein
MKHRVASKNTLDTSPIPMLATAVVHRRALARAVAAATTTTRATHRLSNGCFVGGAAVAAMTTTTTSTISFSCGSFPLQMRHPHPEQQPPHSPPFFTRRTNFSYAGPRKLSDILKSELLVDKSSTEIVRHSSLFILLWDTFLFFSCMFFSLSNYCLLSMIIAPVCTIIHELVRFMDGLP